MTDVVVTSEEVAVTLEDDGEVTIVLAPEETTISISEVGVQGAPGPSDYPFPFSMTEDIEVRVGESYVIIQHADMEIAGVSLWLTTPAQGAPVIVDVNVNDTSIWTLQADQPRILAGSQGGSFVTDMDVTMLSPGDRLSVDVDQVGSSVPGRFLSVTIWVRRTSA